VDSAAAEPAPAPADQPAEPPAPAEEPANSSEPTEDRDEVREERKEERREEKAHEPKRAQRATSNVFALFNQAQIQEFKEVDKPTAALPFSSSGFTAWIPQTVYCYF